MGYNTGYISTVFFPRDFWLPSTGAPYQPWFEEWEHGDVHQCERSMERKAWATNLPMEGIQSCKRGEPHHRIAHRCHHSFGKLKKDRDFLEHKQQAKVWQTCGCLKIQRSQEPIGCLMTHLLKDLGEPANLEIASCRNMVSRNTTRYRQDPGGNHVDRSLSSRWEQRLAVRVPGTILPWTAISIEFGDSTCLYNSIYQNQSSSKIQEERWLPLEVKRKDRTGL